MIDTNQLIIIKHLIEKSSLSEHHPIYHAKKKDL